MQALDAIHNCELEAKRHSTMRRDTRGWNWYRVLRFQLGAVSRVPHISTFILSHTTNHEESAWWADKVKKPTSSSLRQFEFFGVFGVYMWN